MRRGGAAWLVVMLAGCSFRAGAIGGGGGDDVDGGTDGASDGTVTKSVIDQDGSAFSALVLGTSPALTAAVITARGTIEPDAYVLGGLHARAFAQASVTSITTTYAQATATLGTELGERYGELPITDWNQGVPRDLGVPIADANLFEVVYDGEIYLAGATTLAVSADDFGVFEISTDGTTYTGVHGGYNVAVTQSVITPPAPGWYPIRGAVSDSNGGARMLLEVLNASNTLVPIAPSQLRARVTTAPGLVVSGFGSASLFGLIGSALEPGPIAESWSGVPSYDLGSGSGGSGTQQTAGNFSLRYSGQVLVDQAEAEKLSAVIGGDNGEQYRLALDGTVIASQTWPGLADHATSAAIALTAGWHDLVLDYSHISGSPAGLTLQRTTASSAVAATIPADHLRPAVARGQIASNLVTGTTVATSGMTPATIMVPMTAPPGAVIDSVDFGATVITGGTRTDFAATVASGSASDTYALPASADDAVNSSDYAGERASFAGMALATAQPWTVAVANATADNATATFNNAGIAASYHGGPQVPFAPTFVYTSSPRAIAGALRIDGAVVTADLRGATAKIEVRSGDDTTVLTAPWIDITTAAPPASPASYLQYRVTITGPGWQLASVAKVEIDYQVAGPSM